MTPKPFRHQDARDRTLPLRNNPSLRLETPGHPGIFFIGRGHPHVRRSTIE